MTTEQSRAVIEAIYAAVQRQDHVAFKALLHPELRVSSAPYFAHGGPDSTVEQWEQMLAGLAPALDISGLTLVSLIADGDEVSATARVKLGESSDEVLFCENWTVQGGKAYRMRVYCYDPSVLLARVGAQALASAPGERPAWIDSQPIE